APSRAWVVVATRLLALSPEEQAEIAGVRQSAKNPAYFRAVTAVRRRERSLFFETMFNFIPSRIALVRRAHHAEVKDSARERSGKVQAHTYPDPRRARGLVPSAARIDSGAFDGRGILVGSEQRATRICDHDVSCVVD